MSAKNKQLSNYAKIMADKIIGDVLDLINSKSNGHQRTSSMLKTTNGASNGTMFVYRIFPVKKIIDFNNLKIKPTLRGKQILSKILDIIEPICDYLDYTIKISDFSNFALAKYLMDKRKYQLFHDYGVNSIEIFNTIEINKKLKKESYNRKSIPSWSQRKPIKRNSGKWV